MVLKWHKSAWIKIRKKCNLGKQPYLSQTLISTILNFVQMGMKPLFTDALCFLFYSLIKCNYILSSKIT